MNKVLILFCASIGVLVGCGKTFHGNLTTADNQPLVINHDEGQTVVQPGQLKIKLHQGSMLGDGKLELISQSGKSVKISVPKETALKALSFQLEQSDIKQNFGLIGRQQVSEPTVYTKETSEGCTHCGYCYSTRLTRDSSGRSSLKRSYGHSCSCRGHQEVLREYTSIAKTFEIDFIQENHKQAVFTSDPIIENTSKVLQEITSCR